MNEKILKYKIPVITVFILITVLSVLLLPKVTVNYDLMDYLPKDSPSTKALEAMETAFGEISDGGGTRVLTQYVTIAKALECKAEIAAVPGVSEVLWLDDYANLNQPLSFINEKQLNSYYKDGNALFTVRFEESTTGKETAAALSAIREIIGEDGAMSGGAVKNTAAKQETSGQVKTMMLWLVPVVLLIMLFATSSWFEPVLFIVTIGVAIIINMGTNAFLDDISFVTQTAAAVLQLAVSIDYSIFLLHSFAEQRGKGLSPRDAMLAAMKQSYPSIIASAVTTILGFAVLVLMRFLIGADMGIVLAKGVVFSLLSVILLLPGLALLTYKLIDKTHHRSFFPSFERFGKLVVKIAAPVMILIVVIAVPAFLAQGRNEFIYGDSAVTGDESSQIGRDERIIGELFGKQNQLILLVPEGDFPKELTLANEFLTLPYAIISGGRRCDAKDFDCRRR